MDGKPCSPRGTCCSAILVLLIGSRDAIDELIIHLLVSSLSVLDLLLPSHIPSAVADYFTVKSTHFKSMQKRHEKMLGGVASNFVVI